MTEDLIDALTMVKGVRVRSRGVSMSLSGDNRDPRARQRSGVQLVVDGSMRRLGDSLRLTVRLINVEDGIQVWAQRFDSQVAQVFALSDTVTAALAQALTSQLGQTLERAKLSDAQAIENTSKPSKSITLPPPTVCPESIALFEDFWSVAKTIRSFCRLCAGAGRQWFFGNLGLPTSASCGGRACKRHQTAASRTWRWRW